MMIRSIWFDGKITCMFVRVSVISIEGPQVRRYICLGTTWVLIRVWWVPRSIPLTKYLGVPN